MRHLTPTAAPLAATIILLTNSAPALSQLVLEEVIVTAQKRSESLQDVPIAVSAISGEKIVEAGIQGLTDLSDYIPNVTINTTAGDSPANIIIRGVGSGNNAGFEQSVGMFNDGVYQGRARQYLVPFLDVGSVEVLKGPQGTLFGKNTVAGAISVKSARPTAELEGRLSAQYELEYGSTEYTGFISGPLGDRVGGRLAGKYRDQQGYVDNLIRNADEPEAESSAVRGSLVWDASDSVEVYTKLEYAERDTYGGDYQSIGTDGVFTGLGPPLFQRDLITPLEDGKADDKTTFDSVSEEFSETDALNGVIEINWELATVTLTSVTGFSNYDAEYFLDGDQSDLHFLDQNNKEEFDQVSQEIRLASAGEGNFDYIVGLYLEQQDLEVYSIADLALSNLGLPTPSFSQVNDFEQDGEAAAAFGQVRWYINNDWSLTGGLRFAYEKKEASLDIVNSDFGETDPTSNPLIDLLANRILGRVPGFLDMERSTENWSPTLNLQWEFSDSGMAYARVSRGYKSGGFNPRAVDATRPDVYEFDDEKVDGIEIGSKLKLLGGAATINAALFYSEFTDRQVSTFVDTGFIVGNAAESTSKGLEIDARLITSPHLIFGLSMAYLKSEFDEFKDAGCAGEQQRLINPVPGCINEVQDLTGRTTKNAPEWGATFTTNVFYPVGENLEFRAALDVIYSDAFYFDQSLDSNLVQGSFTKINARLALASSEDTWEVALIGKNLSDELTHATGANTTAFTGSYFASVSAPRTVAVEASYRF